MSIKKKTAKQVVDEVIEKVKEELAVPAPKAEETKDEAKHYYLCNVTLENGKTCNCVAFI